MTETGGSLIQHSALDSTVRLHADLLSVQKPSNGDPNLKSELGDSMALTMNALQTLNKIFEVLIR